MSDPIRDHYDQAYEEGKAAGLREAARLEASQSWGHDPLCMPGLKTDDSTNCVWCAFIRAAREDERRKLRATLATSQQHVETSPRLQPTKEPPIPNA